MSQRRVLVVGGGVGGPVLAYWLAKGGFQVTIIERASKLYKSGQGIDIDGAARDIVERMGVLDEIKSRTTGEAGFSFIDDNAQIIASIFGGITREIEIMRGDLAEIFINAADKSENVTFRYGTTIADLQQTPDHVSVTFNNGDHAEFAAVIGVDGLRSKTREQIFDLDEVKRCFKPKNLYIAYFSIAREPHDGDTSRFQHATGGRTMLIRPVKKDISSGYLNVCAESHELQSALESRDKEAQKAAMADIFAGVGGEGPRLVEQMKSADNFYFERITQVKLNSWSQGRCVLVGDAAYAPSPLTGAGTQLAILGAYIVAGEMTRSPDDPTVAFKAYEDRLRGFVEKQQTIPLNGKLPNLVNPKSAWAIWILRTIFWLIARSGIWKLVDPGTSDSFKLPEYTGLYP